MDLICLMDDMDGCLQKVRKLLNLPIITRNDTKYTT